MLKFAALAVAVTVAGPSYSGTVEERQLERMQQRAEGSARERERQALAVLIQRHWVEGEAQERGIVVTPAQVEEEFASSVAQSFDTRKAFKAFLKRTHQSEGDVKATVRGDLLTAAIRDQVTEPAAKSVTPDQVKAYVDANPQLLPATRTVRLVASGSRREAKAVLRKLRRGATWSSMDGSKETFAVGEHPAGRAMFRAPLNRLARYGVYVFRVIKHTPARPEPRAQQEARAWELLASEAQERALNEFTAQFTAKWRQRTACAPQYAHHEDCGQPPSGQRTP